MIQFKGRSLNWTKITMGQNYFWKNYTARPWDTQPLGGSPSRCTILAELQFWIGFKNFWDTRILLWCSTISFKFLRYLIFLLILRGFCNDFFGELFTLIHGFHDTRFFFQEPETWGLAVSLEKLALDDLRSKKIFWASEKARKIYETG